MLKESQKDGFLERLRIGVSLEISNGELEFLCKDLSKKCFTCGLRLRSGTFL